ncbi:hypothetical protein CEE39_05270 [bacterium (candidate division B38) B3_B38]|nr:MAG: hypothetical protein CEE39_05270 [bacterium (candidate division B38) B3_B38]
MSRQDIGQFLFFLRVQNCYIAYPKIYILSSYQKGKGRHTITSANIFLIGVRIAGRQKNLAAGEKVRLLKLLPRACYMDFFSMTTL